MRRDQQSGIGISAFHPFLDSKEGAKVGFKVKETARIKSNFRAIVLVNHIPAYLLFLWLDQASIQLHLR
jgi:hypothetical protein